MKEPIIKIIVDPNTGRRVTITTEHPDEESKGRSVPAAPQPADEDDDGGDE